MPFVGMIENSEYIITELEYDFDFTMTNVNMYNQTEEDMKLIEVGLSIETALNGAAPAMTINKGGAEIVKASYLPLKEEGNLVKHWVNSNFTDQYPEVQEIVSFSLDPDGSSAGSGTIHLFIKKRR